MVHLFANFRLNVRRLVLQIIGVSYGFKEVCSPIITTGGTANSRETTAKHTFSGNNPTLRKVNKNV